MPRNGSGGYVPPAGQPVISGTAISSTVFNALVADLGNELTKSVCTDGQTPMTANLPMGANRITNLAAAVAASDAARLDQVTAAVAGCLPTAGGTMTGPITCAQGSGLFAKDTTGGVHQVIQYGGDNNVNLVNGIGGFTRLYNSTAAAVVFQVDNSGNLSQAGGITLENNATFSSKDAGGVARPLTYMAGNTVVNRVAGGATIVWYNQAGTTQLAGLDNSGTFSAIVVTQTSDERKKKLWQRLPHDFVKQLAGIRKSGLFTWRKGGALGIGVGAQSFERIFPAAVHTDEKGWKSVNYGAAALVSCVELAREVEVLKAALAKLVSK